MTILHFQSGTIQKVSNRIVEVCGLVGPIKIFCWIIWHTESDGVIFQRWIMHKIEPFGADSAALASVFTRQQRLGLLRNHFCQNENDSFMFQQAVPFSRKKLYAMCVYNYILCWELDIFYFCFNYRMGFKGYLCIATVLKRAGSWHTLHEGDIGMQMQYYHHPHNYYMFQWKVAIRVRQ